MLHQTNRLQLYLFFLHPRFDLCRSLRRPWEETRLIEQQDGNVSWRRESARKGLNTTSDAQFAALPLVKPVVWFARVFVNWRSRSVAKSAYCSGKKRGFISRTVAGNPACLYPQSLSLLHVMSDTFTSRC